jgi:hypothetical protein
MIGLNSKKSVLLQRTIVQSALDALAEVPHSVSVMAGVCTTQNKPIAAILLTILLFIIPLPFLDALSVPSCLPFNTASSHSDQDRFSDHCPIPVAVPRQSAESGLVSGCNLGPR